MFHRYIVASASGENERNRLETGVILSYNSYDLLEFLRDSENSFFCGWNSSDSTEEIGQIRIWHIFTKRFHIP